jgi:hypothetical protein
LQDWARSALEQRLLRGCWVALAAALVLLSCAASASAGNRLGAYANASVQAAALPNSGAAGFRISNAAAGDYSAFMRAPSGEYLRVLNNLPYVFSVDVEGGTTARQEISVQIEWRSARGHLLGTSLGYPSNPTSIVSAGAGTSPQRLVAYGESPPNAATALPKIVVTGSPPPGSAIFAQAPGFRLATAAETPPHPSSFVPVTRDAGRRYRYDPFGPWLDAGPRGPLTSEACVPTADNPCLGLDGHGIPIVNYGGTIGVQYNPFTIAGDGLQWYSSFLYSRQRTQLRDAVREANWLVAHQEPDGRWLYRFPDAEYLIQRPWPSAITQGAGISLLVRMWRHTRDHRYLKAAERALLPYSRPVASGGVLALWGKHWFYEEAPSPARPAFILNGFMVALIGLYDLSVAAPRSNAKTLYKRGWNSLVAMLPLYDDGVGKSTYNLEYLTMGGPKVPATSTYDGRHVVDLKAINSVSPSPILRYFMRRWSRRS